MNETIAITSKAFDCASELADFLRHVSGRVQDMLQLTDDRAFVESKCPSSRFVIFWGPPNASESEVVSVLDSLPKGEISIGCSAENCIIDGEPQLAKWCAVVVDSPYIMPHASFGELGQPEADQGGPIDTCIDKFVKELPDPYFRAGRALGQPRAGGHGVIYMRPAILFVFLPGMGAEVQLNWPASNKDYQIVEALAARVSRNVAIFGGSAAAGWPKGKGDRDWQAPWLAINDGDEHKSVYRRGIVGLLVETDLSFGCASEHGLEPDPLHGCHIREKGAEVEITDPPRLVKGMPPRFHVVKLDIPEGMPYELYHLDNPSLANPKGVILKNGSDQWHTLVTYELDEVLPNPSYRTSGDDKDGKFEFLRPVTRGSTLYHAMGDKESIVQAIVKARDEAFDLGQVRDPAGLFIFDCRGRLRLLGAESGPIEEMARLKQGLSGETSVFGMYGDGETCSSPRGIHLHRNWTASVLALGSNFHRRYADEARKQLLSGLDHMITEQSNLNILLQRIVQIALVLLQADSCHIRMVSDNGKSLEWMYGVGQWSQLVRLAIDLSDASVDKNLTAYEAFQSRKLVKSPKEDYVKREIDFSQWRGEQSEIFDLMSKLEWWMSVPILEMGECLGVLSLVSRKTNFLQEDRGRIEELAEVLAATAALPIRCTMIKEALQEALLAASHAKNPRELAKRIVGYGARLLGHGAYLALLLPDDFEQPTKLTCLACAGPNADKYESRIFVHLDEGPADCGICGYVFKHKEAWCHDNAAQAADGSEGKPIFKRCIPGTVANYVVPLLVEDSEGNTKALGVLSAEAGKEVLRYEVHQDVLTALADACATSIAQWIRQKRMRNYLCRLLPEHVVTSLEKDEGKSLFETPRERKVVTILYADIRGYTAVSEVVGEERILKFMDQYYTMLARAIAETNGTLDKFMGDGVIALYGDTTAVPDIYRDDKNVRRARESLKDAIRAGLKIATEFGTLADKWIRRWRRECPQLGQNHHLEIGVLLHNGKPIVGLFHTGADETEGHMTYTAIGRDVNIAARLGGKVDQNEVYVTASAWELLRDDGEFEVVQQPSTVRGLKGIQMPLEIFKVSEKK